MEHENKSCIISTDEESVGSKEFMISFKMCIRDSLMPEVEENKKKVNKNCDCIYVEMYSYCLNFCIFYSGNSSRSERCIHVYTDQSSSGHRTKQDTMGTVCKPVTPVDSV